MGTTWALPENVQLLKSLISFAMLTTFHLFDCLGPYHLVHPAHWLCKPELCYYQLLCGLPSFILFRLYGIHHSVHFLSIPTPLHFIFCSIIILYQLPRVAVTKHHNVWLKTIDIFISQIEDNSFEISNTEPKSWSWLGCAFSKGPGRKYTACFFQFLDGASIPWLVTAPLDF